MHLTTNFYYVFCIGGLLKLAASVLSAMAVAGSYIAPGVSSKLQTPGLNVASAVKPVHRS